VRVFNQCEADGCTIKSKKNSYFIYVLKRL